jgi:hypothetical protein
VRTPAKEFEIVRRAYSKQVMARKDFLGHDPIHLCTDDLTGILPERDLNKGWP